MERIAAARRGPFLVVAAVALILAIALFRLPEEFVAGLKRDRPLELGAAGWLYRLLVLAAAGQATYVGLALLHPEKVRHDRLRDPKLAARPPGESVRVLARNAAGMAGLTLVYAAGSFLLTGERAGVWLFLFIFACSLAWNYRQTGLAASLIERDGVREDAGASGP